MTDTAPAIPAPNPTKAAPWFKKAFDCEKTKTYDYAITSYVMGLQFDPDNLDMVKKLLNVGRVRAAAGGAAGGGLFGESYSVKGTGPLFEYLNALESYTKDQSNIGKLERLTWASTACRLEKVGEFFGDELWKGNRAEKSNSTKLARYRRLKDHFKSLELFKKAFDCMQEAQPLAPEDLEINTELKNLAAQDVTKKGKYENTDGDFRGSIQNFEKQKELLQANADVKSEEFLRKQILTTREKWQKEPNNSGLLRAYVEALLKLPTLENRNAAIKVLEEAFAKTGEYQLKLKASDIRIRIAMEKLNELRTKAETETEPAKKQAMLDQHAKDAKALLEFEIKEYSERAVKYPTDREIKYELGRRCLEAGRLDDAIDNLQAAEAMPKIRVRVLQLLGTAFIQKGWHEEAVDSFRRAIETYQGIESDETNLKLHYSLADALEASGDLAEALKEFSYVARIKLTYRDVRDRVHKLKAATKAAAKSV